MTFTGCPAHLRRRTLFEKNGACLPVLFHVLEPRVFNLFEATSGKPSSPYSHKDRSTLSALAARSESRLPVSARPAARNPPAQSDRAHAERPPGSPIPPPAAGTKRPPRYLSRSPPAHCAPPPRGIHGHLLPEPP